VCFSCVFMCMCVVSSVCVYVCGFHVCVCVSVSVCLSVCLLALYSDFGILL